MNGRIYDPVMGRILSPDIFVQAPGYTQSYNRYSYCMNNPLRYTDPSGYTYYECTWGRDINQVADRNSITFYSYGVGSPGNYFSGKGGGDGSSNGTYYASGGGGTFIQQLASSTQYLPSGYYNLTGLDYNNGSFEFTYDYNSAGNEEANRQKAYNERTALGAASNSVYGKSFGGDGIPPTGFKFYSLDGKLLWDTKMTGMPNRIMVFEPQWEGQTFEALKQYYSNRNEPFGLFWRMRELSIEYNSLTDTKSLYVYEKLSTSTKLSMFFSFAIEGMGAGLGMGYYYKTQPGLVHHYEMLNGSKDYWKNRTSIKIFQPWWE